MPGRDLKREMRQFYAPRPEPTLVDVPELSFILVEGSGAPDEGADAPTTEFQQAIGALYPVAYTLKFTMRAEIGLNATVMPLEALWHAGEGGLLDATTPPSEWTWRAMIAVPDEVTPELFERCVAEAGRKRPNPMLERVRFERWREGPSVQLMHIGPYSEERPSIERMLAFAREHGFVPRGAHHEIYLGDPRNADPAKLKTVLRQPVEPAPVLVAV